MRREAVILAGGLGTRLRGVIDDLPKSMAPVNGRPFLAYVLDHMSKYRITRAILAAGYRKDDIIAFFGKKYNEIELEYSVEDEPLGTGGAILKASESINSDSFLVLNGDTLFTLDLEDFRKSFEDYNASLSVALKPMVNFDRYGSVTMEEGRIISFNEKKYFERGLINGGVYFLSKDWIHKYAPSEKFSFEKDIMERRVGNDTITGYISDSYFIDIGVPEDYERANRELPLKIY